MTSDAVGIGWTKDILLRILRLFDPTAHLIKHFLRYLRSSYDVFAKKVDS